MIPARAPAFTPGFLITIDTEGDNLWGCPQQVTTRNAAFLPRFARLCEEFGFKPTWLTTHEMAMDPAFLHFGREAVRRGQAEIGMHLHAWNSPPLTPLTDDDARHQPYLVEYPAELMHAKVDLMTRLLRERFETPVVSHRAGRWSLDSAYAGLLAQQGYLIDCSVAPHVSWADTPGQPGGNGGTDYRHFPDRPYVMDLDHIDRAGASPLLELPVSVIRSRLNRLAPWSYQLPGFRRWAWRHQPDLLWLYPTGHNLADLQCVVQEAVLTQRPCLEMVLHSSELMPGGRQTLHDVASIERLYHDLRALFTVIAHAFVGMTLAEFRQAWLGTQPQAQAHPAPALPST